MLKWFGYLKRKSDESLSRKVYKAEVAGTTKKKKKKELISVVKLVVKPVHSSHGSKTTQFTT